MRRRNLQILFNNTTLIPFKWRGKYLCFYCGENLPDFTILRQHTVSHGKCSENDRAIKLVKSTDSEVKIDVSVIKCNICNNELDSFDNLITHITSKHELPYDKDVLEITTYRLIDLKCLQCEEKFNSFGNLIVHMNKEHSNKCFVCTDCDRKFNKKRDLATHKRTHHRQSYTCNKCPTTFKTQVELNTHKLNDHESECNICFKHFPSGKERLAHMRVEHESDLKCRICHKFMTTKQKLLQHANNCTKTENADKIVANKKTNLKQIKKDIVFILNNSTAIPFKYYITKFRCFYCSKDFKNPNLLKEHTISEHTVCDIKTLKLKLTEGSIKIDVNSLSCKICNENLTDLVHLINHFDVEHKITLSKNITDVLQHFKISQDRYPCPLCEIEYRHFSMLLKHISMSHTENNFTCSYCGLCFRYKLNLRTHIVRKHKPATFKCTYCVKKFTSNTYLKVHLGKEHGLKVVKCSQCMEKFTSQYNMQRHLIQAHKAGYECKYCKKLFINTAFMIKHVKRTHLKEKNYECLICFEKFFDKYQLNIHMVKHYGERNFHCNFCDKKFMWKKNLRVHMMSHIKKQ